MEPDTVRSNQGDSSRTLSPGIGGETRVEAPRSVRKGWWPTFSDSRRLTSSIGVAEVEIDHLARCKPPGEPGPMWAESARLLLLRSKQARDRKDIEAGWRYLHAAQRVALHGLPPEELRTRAASLAIEVQEKLIGWRRGSIMRIVGQVAPAAAASATEIALRPDTRAEGLREVDDTARPHELTAAQVAFATQLRDEYFDNQHSQIHTLQEKLTVLLMVLLLAVVAVLLRFAFRPENKLLLMPASDQTAGMSIDFTAVTLFGCLGASLSAITSLARLSTKSRIPQQRFDTFVTMMRPVVGAAAALGLCVFLVSGLLDLGPLIPGRLLAVSFAAGFSERLIIRTVESVAGQSGETRGSSGNPPRAAAAG